MNNLKKIKFMSSLEKGEILEKNFTELTCQGSKEALYEEWLKDIGMSRTTAWRHRNRYKLCMMVSQGKKMFVSSFSNGLIKDILNYEDIEGVIKMINDNAELIELKKVLKFIQIMRTDLRILNFIR